MPIYGYGCKSCDHRLDALQKMSDEPLVDCPACGEPALKRLLSAPRFRLKGDGWYETDFKKDKQRNIHGEKEPAKADQKSDKSDKSDKSGKSDTDSKQDSKKDAKTASKNTNSKATVT